MIDLFKRSIVDQMEASLCMLDECIRECPDDGWDGAVAKYPFWHVAYHALCYVDVYLSANNDAWQPQTGADGLHPKGREELEEEYPSRRFGRRELIEYLAICREKLRTALAAETAESLAGESGFSHLPIPRAELHLYNLRHVQHHIGQLGAYVRRLDRSPGWVKTGWQ